MKWLFSIMVLALAACATNSQCVPPERAVTSESTRKVGTLSISGDELKQTGRTDPSDALRATSPIFH